MGAGAILVIVDANVGCCVRHCQSTVGLGTSRLQTPVDDGISYQKDEKRRKDQRPPVN